MKQTNEGKIGNSIEFSSYHNQYKLKLWDGIYINKK